jgi:hypothetical protein
LKYVEQFLPLNWEAAGYDTRFYSRAWDPVRAGDDNAFSVALPGKIEAAQVPLELTLVAERRVGMMREPMTSFSARTVRWSVKTAPRMTLRRCAAIGNRIGRDAGRHHESFSVALWRLWKFERSKFEKKLVRAHPICAFH